MVAYNYIFAGIGLSKNMCSGRINIWRHVLFYAHLVAGVGEGVGNSLFCLYIGRVQIDGNITYWFLFDNSSIDLYKNYCDKDFYNENFSY